MNLKKYTSEVKENTVRVCDFVFVFVKYIITRKDERNNSNECKSFRDNGHIQLRRNSV